MTTDCKNEPVVDTESADKPHTTNVVIDNEAWKPFLAFTFMIIVLFDFVIAPSSMGMSHISVTNLVPMLQGLDKEVQQQLIAANSQTWKPLTLGDGVGMFYLAIGAILTGVAIFGPGGRSAGK
ncbi:MAG: hypothetical protein ACRC6V_03435 [Bacteroidales bacterium]